MSTNYTGRYYLMNTHSKVMTDQPQHNEYGHQHCTFLWIVDENGRNPKVVADYGPALPVGTRIPCTQDTGLGHRHMRTHVVVATRDPEQVQTGTLPSPRTLPFWVTK